MAKAVKRKPPKGDHPHVEQALAYAEGVVSGDILACKWVRLACARQLSDLKRPTTATFPYVFDPDAAERVCYFISQLRHTKGKWANEGLTITLEPWQCFGLVTIFGWKHKTTGYRRFRTAYEEVPRKNAKSTKASGVGLYMLTADGEMGAEVYSAATMREQAKIVFKDSQRMAKKDEKFREHFGLTVQAHALICSATDSAFTALSAEGDTLDGLNIHCVIVDELHAHKTREVWDVLETATGSRTQSLVYAITTAGSNRSGVCYEQRSYVQKILEGVVADETYFGIIYTLDEGDDWTDPKNWAKANPNYGVSVFPDDLARLANKAQKMVSARNNFLTKRLNIWVNADVAWMDMDKWKKCGDENMDIDDYRGREGVIAFDLATKIDIVARITLLTPTEEDPMYRVFCKFYLPEETVEESDNASYAGWADSGAITTTEGSIIDFNLLESDLLEDAPMFTIKEVGYDPFQATQFANNMVSQGVPMVEVRQSVQNMSEAMKSLEALVTSGKLMHDANPAMEWMISNVVCHTDAKDNIYPKKESVDKKIDGPVGLIMALSRVIMTPGESRSVYEERGLRTL